MLTNITIFCTCEFEALHCWPEAPAEVAFLRTAHRHLFKARIECDVDHHNRQIEFLLLKRKAQSIIEEILDHTDTRTWSCEMWAHELLVSLDACLVEVSEDGENGAVVTRCELNVQSND